MSDRTDDRFTPLLSEYLDEGLDEVARREVGEHLAGCAACAATLEELRAVKQRARTLPDAPPGADLWPAIAARIGGDRGGSPAIRPFRRVGAPVRARRLLAFSMPQALAAGLAVALVSAAAMWLALRHHDRAAAPLSARDSLPSTGPGGLAGSASRPLEARDAVEDLNRLRRILAEGRDRLDPRTVRTLEENLRIIEIAIAQSRRALETDPGDPYVRGHLTDTMRRKVELMHRAAVLASAP
ncbi:MAG TPA: zf-HC2 domain-containing protein [Candidatus Eisenbacteria bacterium]|jgi:hypothetical protein